MTPQIEAEIFFTPFIFDPLMNTNNVLSFSSRTPTPNLLLEIYYKKIIIIILILYYNIILDKYRDRSGWNCNTISIVGEEKKCI